MYECHDNTHIHTHTHTLVQCKKNGKECFTLIVLNPSIVIGKMLNDVKSMKSINSSLGIFVDLLNKKLPVVFDMNFAYV
jgi:hypothetical protein